jgi:hypothetical protein
LEQATADKYAAEVQLTGQKYSTEYWKTQEAAGEAKTAQAAGEWNKYNYGWQSLTNSMFMTIGTLGKAAK